MKFILWTFMMFKLFWSSKDGFFSPEPVSETEVIHLFLKNMTYQITMYFQHQTKLLSFKILFISCGDLFPLFASVTLLIPLVLRGKIQTLNMCSFLWSSSKPHLYCFTRCPGKYVSIVKDSGHFLMKKCLIFLRCLPFLCTSLFIIILLAFMLIDWTGIREEISRFFFKEKTFSCSHVAQYFTWVYVRNTNDKEFGNPVKIMSICKNV